MRPIVSIPFASGLSFLLKGLCPVRWPKHVSIPFASGLSFLRKVPGRPFGLDADNMFQSPSHRGCPSYRRRCWPTSTAPCVSIPFASGLSFLPSAGSGRSQKLSRFNPLRIGAVLLTPKRSVSVRSCTSSFNPLRIGAVLLTALLPDQDIHSAIRFNPLRIGAVLLTCLKVCMRIGNMSCFNPLRIGAVLLTLYTVAVWGVPTLFQSPSHRGCPSYEKTVEGTKKAITDVSIPFASGLSFLPSSSSVSTPTA